MKRIVLIGSKNTGVAALLCLLRHPRRGVDFEIVGVIARPDDLTENWYRSVARTAMDAGIETMLPEKINAEEVVKKIESWHPDIGFCVFHPQIFGRVLIDAFGRLINLHFAPLPRYRGCNPIPHAIIEGQGEHGVTMHEILPGIDDGPIVAQRRFPIDDGMTGLELYQRCEHEGARLFQTALPGVLDGALPGVPQDHASASHHYRRELADKEVDLNWPAEYLERFVRALEFAPFPSPFAVWAGRKVSLATKPGLRYTDAHLDEFFHQAVGA